MLLPNETEGGAGGYFGSKLKTDSIILKRSVETGFGTVTTRGFLKVNRIGAGFVKHHVLVFIK